MKNFIHTLGNIFLTILVIILIVYGWAFIEIKLLLKPQPEIFGFVFYQEQTEDMVPEFDKSDVIIVKKNADYKSGDVILYFDSVDSLYKAHYVVSTDSLETVTKSAVGNTNNKAVSNNNVVGKAVGKVYYMGSIIKFFKNKFVLVSIGVVGLAFLVVSQYMEFKPKETKES